jgi:hypothetical protein
MEDDLNFLENGRRPQSFGKWKAVLFFRKWKMTSIFLKVEDDPSIFPMKDNLNLLENGRRPQIIGIWNNLNMFANGRELQYKVNSFLNGMWPCEVMSL